MNDENDQENVDSRSPAAAVVPSASDSTPIYFPVSLTKFVVMHFCTVGMYQLYWFHENWKLILEREQIGREPVLENVFYVHLLLYIV